MSSRPQNFDRMTGCFDIWLLRNLDAYPSAAIVRWPKYCSKPCQHLEAVL